MKRFSFRLERLRELRERAERERAGQLGDAMRDERLRAQALERACRELERAGEQAAGLPAAGPVSAGLLHALDRARGAAESRADEAATSLKGASERVVEEREHYRLARRDLRVVERLKEKRYEAWREQGAREERKESDEVSQHLRITRGEHP